MSNILAVRNVAQRVLFVHELCGQLSDGHWENSRPSDHWEPWCDAVVIVDPANVGREFHVRRDTYDFTSRDLLDVVGNRMVNYVRLAHAFGDCHVELLSRLLDLDGNYRGIPTFTGEYHDKVRARLAEWMANRPGLLEAVQLALNSSVYGVKQLRADLRDLKQIVKVQRQEVKS